jgi:hypothetical protein
MSKNRNRAKLNKAKTGREYQGLQMFNEYCPVCMKRSGSWYYDCHPGRIFGRHGDGRALYAIHRRAYRTWKHTRSSQWKH